MKPCNIMPYNAEVSIFAIWNETLKKWVSCKFVNAEIRFSCRFTFHWRAVLKAVATECDLFQSILLAMVA